MMFYIFTDILAQSKCKGVYTMKARKVLYTSLVAAAGYQFQNRFIW